MEGSADDSGNPGLSKMEDLDASMSRLHLPSNKSPSPPPETAEAMPPSQSSAATSGDARSISGDAMSQVDQVLLEALKNPCKRLAVLQVEQDVEKFIHDSTQGQLEFQKIPNPYLRLVVHHVAQHYHLHSIAIPDGSSYRIVLCKTANSSCAPPVCLADVPVNLPQEDKDSNLMLNVSIKQRPKSSQNISIDTHFSKTNYQKSFEKRREEYDRARARIFNSNDSSTRNCSDPEDKVRLPDNPQDSSFAPARSDEKPLSGGSENSLHSCSDSSHRLNRTKEEKEPFVSRHNASSSVSISQEYDPDYDRSYDRYMPRFVPGFGFNDRPFTSQPLYFPVVNYNIEFSQLRPSHTAQVPIFHQPHSFPPHLHGSGLLVYYCPLEAFSFSHVPRHPTSSVDQPHSFPPHLHGPELSVYYCPPEAFSFSDVPRHPTPSVDMQSSHFSVSPHPGMYSGYPNDRFQSSIQFHRPQ